MRTRLLATDIDGTMLRADGTLSPVVGDALHRAGREGLVVVPATGRPMVVSHDVMGWTGLDGYWIFGNGAMTWHAGRAEIVRSTHMTAEAVELLVSDVRAAVPGAGLAVEFDAAAAYEAGFEDLVFQAPPVPPVDDILSALDHPVLKVLVFDGSDDVEALHARVTAAVGDDGVVTYSGLPFVEVAPSLTTKATAIEALAADLGIAREEVAAIGDNHNDVAMLRWAGRSWAMANASADAIDAADHLAPTSDEDGLAAVIAELLA